jgi:hypothetical protein
MHPKKSLSLLPNHIHRQRRPYGILKWWKNTLDNYRRYFFLTANRESVIQSCVQSCVLSVYQNRSYGSHQS